MNTRLGLGNGLLFRDILVEISQYCNDCYPYQSYKLIKFIVLVKEMQEGDELFCQVKFSSFCQKSQWNGNAILQCTRKSVQSTFHNKTRHDTDNDLSIEP